MKKKLLFLCCGVLWLSLLTGCGSKKDAGSDKDTGNPTQTETVGETVATGEVPASERVETEEAVTQPVYGNDPNNLFQMDNTVCFGNGRVYYINFSDEVASFALDGSDAAVHGVIGNLSEGSYGGSALNWYNGKVYYMITQYREDYTRFVEVRSMDVETGEETQIAVYDNSDNPTSNSMLIIGDNLFYSCYDTNTKTTSVTVQNLITGESNLILEMTTSSAGLGHAAFASDGANLYLYIYNGFYSVYKMPMSAVYDSEPSCEQVAVVSLNSTVLTGDGMYTDHTDGNTHESSYVFYAYENSGENWPYETVLDHVAADGDTGDEEGIIRNLIWYSTKWMLGDALVSEAQFNRNLYYASSVDYTQSVSVSGLSFEQSAQNGTGLYAGEYEDVLYLILEDENGVSFHTLAADGTYK